MSSSPPAVSSPTTTTAWRDAPTRWISAGGEKYAYRELGPRGGVPLVLLHHLMATIDEWDPRVMDGLAARRHVIAFDNLGVGGSSGKVPGTIGQMASGTIAFIRALDHEQVDLLGFSLGGGVAQSVLLDAPDLVRRAILAGTGPAGGGGIDQMNKIVGGAYLKSVLTLRDVRHYLFFPRTPTGKAAASDYMARIKERTEDRVKGTKLQARLGQLNAIKAAALQAPQDLGKITQPVLVANGDHDVMVASALSEDIANRIPNATLVIYPASGHGGIFQHHAEFVSAALEFLDAA